MATATPTAAEAASPKKTPARKPKAATTQPAEKVAPRKSAKPAAKAAAKPAAKAAKVPSKPAAKAAAKPEKPRKPKLVRDSFTIPKTEYTVLDALKQRATRLGHAAKKSEVLRAGIKALAALSDAALLAALKDVPAIKTGRPSKG